MLFFFRCTPICGDCFEVTSVAVSEMLRACPTDTNFYFSGNVNKFAPVLSLSGDYSTAKIYDAYLSLA